MKTNFTLLEFMRDFEYIHIGLSKGQYIALIIIMILLNIGISAFVVMNDIQNKNDYEK